MIAPITLVFGLFSLASAGPINEIVPVEQCNTIATGKLGTSGSANLTQFGLSKDNILTFGESPLEVEFQSCQPNFGHFDGQDGRPTGGHIVVSSTGQCLTLNPDYAEPPYTFTVADCYFSDDSGQEASAFVQKSDGSIYFVGNTQADGSQNWHADTCRTGYFGVITSAKSGPVEFGCYEGDDKDVALNLSA